MSIERGYVLEEIIYLNSFNSFWLLSVLDDLLELQSSITGCNTSFSLTKTGFDPLDSGGACSSSFSSLIYINFMICN